VFFVKKQLFSLFMSVFMLVSVLSVPCFASGEADEVSAVSEDAADEPTASPELSLALNEAEGTAEEPVLESAETAEPVTDGVSGTYRKSEARSMLAMINQFRTGSEAWCWNEDNTTKTVYNQAGGTQLKALTYDYDLEQIALQRAAELAESFSHTRPDGSMWSDLTYNGIHSWGENIAAGQTTAAEVFQDWQETDYDYSGQGHRRNMLSEEYAAVGIACFVYNGMTYWVQEFGYNVSNAEAPEEPVLLGDVDGDGQIDLKDVTALFQYVNKQRTDLPNAEAAYVTGGETITLKDVTRLFQYVNRQIDTL
jgi:uncharacterized protein YkwD